jgi:hypothetical protein
MVVDLSCWFGVDVGGAKYLIVACIAPPYVHNFIPFTALKLRQKFYFF